MMSLLNWLSERHNRRRKFRISQFIKKMGVSNVFNVMQADYPDLVAHVKLNGVFDASDMLIELLRAKLQMEVRWMWDLKGKDKIGIAVEASVMQLLDYFFIHGRKCDPCK
jgi:hypothetical protein